MPTNRDDFSAKTKRRLAHRAGYVCSFPNCGIHTAGPSDEALDAVNNVGVAAHITAAAPGGPRYDPAMTQEDRESLKNGIWLCETHAKLIDGDVATWTTAVLYKMKGDADLAAKARLAGASPAHGGLTLDVAACVYMKSIRAAYVPAMIVNESSTPVTIKAVQLRLGSDVFAPNKPRSNLTLEGCDWFPAGPIRLQAADAQFGAWYFGWSFEGGGRYVEAVPGTNVDLVLSPVGRPELVVKLDLIHPDDHQTAHSALVAPARSGTAAAALDHDRSLFRRVDAAFPEVRLIALADRLQTSDDYTDSDLTLCLHLLDLAKLESNRFCDENLNAHFLRLADSLKNLLRFTSTRFFLYPEKQKIGDDTQYALAPHLNMDRGARVSEKSSNEYAELQRELDERVKTCRESYRKFRAEVRIALAV